MVVYLPILTLTGVEGKMFHADGVHGDRWRSLGALMLSVTFVPAAVALLVTRRRISEKENLVMRWARAAVRAGCWRRALRIGGRCGRRRRRARRR